MAADIAGQYLPERGCTSSQKVLIAAVACAVIRDLIRRLAEKVWLASRRESRIARTVVLKLRTKEFNIHRRSYTPSVPPTTCEELTAIALSLRERLELGPERLFRLVGVGLGNFREYRAADRSVPSL